MFCLLALPGLLLVLAQGTEQIFDLEGDLLGARQVGVGLVSIPVTSGPETEDQRCEDRDLEDVHH